MTDIVQCSVCGNYRGHCGYPNRCPNPNKANFERLRHALGDIRICAAGPGDRRAIVDKVYEIATRALRGDSTR
jgi:hypothetical protein